MVYLIFFILLFFIYLRFMKGTVFEVSLRRNRFGGVLVARELFLLVLLGVMLFGVVGTSGFNVVHVREEDVDRTGVLVFFTVFLLFSSISFLSKTLFSRYLCFNGRDISGCSDVNKIKWLLRVVFIVLLLFLVVAHATGTSHAFLRSIVAGEDLMTVRLSNKYQSYTPSYVVAYMNYTFYFGAILLGYFGARLLSPLAHLVFILLILYAASLGGGKAPIVQVFALYFITYAVQKNYSLSVLCSIGLAISSGMFLLIYLTVRVQYPEMQLSGFLTYLVDRLGVGQIQGVFEQFSLGLRDFRYIYIEIPFSGFFFEPKMFSKDLMMNTWASGSNYEDTGVMNSFFVGEAYAIGGYLFALVSPIFVAFNFCLICYLVSHVLHKRLGCCTLDAKVIAPLFVSSVLMFTGDLNGMLVGKRLIFVVTYFLALYLAANIFSTIMKPYLVSAPYVRRREGRSTMSDR